MTVYQAIAQMRETSKNGGTFAITFISYSIDRDQTNGIAEVHRARLRPRSKNSNNRYAELQEEYIDTTTGEPRRFWHCCLLSLNGQSLTLADQQTPHQ